MLFIKNGLVKTMVGADIKNGCVLIGDDGKIIEVGENISAPEGAEIIDAEGRLVTPGCVEAHAHVGLMTDGVGWEGTDDEEFVDPITPHLRAIDSINPQSEDLAEAVSYGVTSACTGPGSTNVVNGTFAAIKLAGKRVDKMIIKYPLAMKCAFGENPKRWHGKNSKRSPMTRMAVAAMLRELVFKTKRYVEDKEAGKNPAFDMKLEAMIPVIKGELPLKCHAHRADDIFTAIRIAKEFGLKITIEHCTDGEVIAEHLAKEGIPCFVGPSFGRRSKIETRSKSFGTTAALYRAGVPFSIITDAPVTPLKYLTTCAAFSVNEGLPMEEAWKAITVYPATYSGIGDRVGSLEKGKDGDVVIWTDDPLIHIGARAHVTVIDGKIVHKD